MRTRTLRTIVLVWLLVMLVVGIALARKPQPSLWGYVEGEMRLVGDYPKVGEIFEVVYEIKVSETADWRPREDYLKDDYAAVIRCIPPEAAEIVGQDKFPFSGLTIGGTKEFRARCRILKPVTFFEISGNLDRVIEGRLYGNVAEFTGIFLFLIDPATGQYGTKGEWLKKATNVFWKYENIGHQWLSEPSQEWEGGNRKIAEEMKRFAPAVSDSEALCLDRDDYLLIINAIGDPDATDSSRVVHLLNAGWLQAQRAGAEEHDKWLNEFMRKNKGRWGGDSDSNSFRDSDPNSGAPPPTSFVDSSSLPEGGWEGVPSVSPVWVLGVDGERASVIVNEFRDGRDLAAAGFRFPVDMVQVHTSELSVREGMARSGPYLDITRYVEVAKDGTVPSERIVWVSADTIGGVGVNRGTSLTGSAALFAADGRTEIKGPGGVRLGLIPYELRPATFYDAAQRIVANTTRVIDVGGRSDTVSKFLMFDLAGNVLYESDWSACLHTQPWVNRVGDVLGFRLERCASKGLYVYYVEERTLSKLPDELNERRLFFSPNGRSLVAARSSDLALYSMRVPGAPRRLWDKTYRQKMYEMALSDGPEFLCYGVLGNRNPVYDEIFVVSAADCTPIARLVPVGGVEITGPMEFVDKYLFTGTSFTHPTGSAETRFVCVFDLSALPDGRR